MVDASANLASGAQYADDASPNLASGAQNTDDASNSDEEVVTSSDSEAVAITVAAVSSRLNRPQLTMHI